MGFSVGMQFYEDFLQSYYNVLFDSELSRNLAKRGIFMNLKEKVYKVIMDELNIQEGDNFIIQYYIDGNRKELECVFKNGELKNAFTYDNLSGKMLATLLAKDTVIQKKPWKPKNGDVFYYYNPRGSYIDVRNFVGIFDIALYKSGNCFKRKEDITDEFKEKIKAEYYEFFGE